ncbi:hypothetical protein [Evansella tamaricis]|uniref:Uncharacterized protein n=1 Tax=Evansella tamaricis TaxID=2069301 RepID=A0ABS6JF14_9BACI|nr:hypothetical protein [Evansella tamaricis]MBU9711050.1 hypothetical protein [Evansella tamaricis]
MAYEPKIWGPTNKFPAISDFNRIEQGLADAFQSIGQKLSTSQFTGQSVLDKLKTVHGHGSGLNADLLDGYHASAFARLTGAEFSGTLGAISGNATALELSAIRGGNRTNKMSLIKNGSVNNYEWALELDTGANNRDFWIRASSGGSIRLNVDGDIRVGGRSVHTGNISYGTSNPSGGSNGDIYIQY